MKWLSWSLVDPYREIGGAEIQALCVGYHLKKDFGVDFEASNKAESLFDRSFDVIQTHGSALPKKFLRRCLAERFASARPLRVHTLHGESIESMKRLGEWHRVGRWKALFREIRGCVVADVILAVRDNLRLVRLMRLLGKRIAIIENGWDSADASPLVHQSRNVKPVDEILGDIERFSPFELFVGRNTDPLKSFSRLESVLDFSFDLRLVAVPGENLAKRPTLLATGPLSPQQLTSVYTRAHALLMSSAVEGMPLVLLEALAHGCPAVVTDIPAHQALAGRGLKNFFVVANAEDPSEWCKTIKSVPTLSAEERSKNASHNRALLRTWSDVSRIAFEAVSRL